MHRKSSRNAGEPAPDAALPDPPEVLSADARVEWERVGPHLVRLGLMTDIDKGALAAYCDAYGDWVATSRAIAALKAKGNNGMVVRTVNGNVMPNPLVSINRAARRDMVRFASVFGMTPAARAGMDIEAGPLGRNPRDGGLTYFD